jgi:hypothetical protein
VMSCEEEEEDRKEERDNYRVQGGSGDLRSTHGVCHRRRGPGDQNQQ